MPPQSVPEWLVCLIACLLVLAGYKAVTTRQAAARLGWFWSRRIAGGGAVALGLFWIALGVLLAVGQAFDVPFVRANLAGERAERAEVGSPSPALRNGTTKSL